MRKLVGKNKIAISIVVVMCLILVFIGGKVFMEKREEKKEQELLKVEKQAVNILKNTFADISEIKFNEVGKNEMTGSYGMYITMKNNQKEQVSFSLTFWEENNEIGSYVINDKNIQKEGVTSTKINVIFTDGMEMEL